MPKRKAQPVPHLLDRLFPRHLTLLAGPRARAHPHRDRQAVDRSPAAPLPRRLRPRLHKDRLQTRHFGRLGLQRHQHRRRFLSRRPEKGL